VILRTGLWLRLLLADQQSILVLQSNDTACQLCEQAGDYYRHPSLSFAFLLIDYTVGAVLGVAFFPCKRCRSGMRPQRATLPTLHPPPIKGLERRLTARGS
jgi:hypothetical protein